MTARPLPPSALLMLMLIAGCAADPSYPSLAPRPVETILSTPPAGTLIDATRDPAVDAEAAARQADAESGARDFATALAAARAAIARPGALTVGSDSWITAQQALTTLGAARAPVAGALADLDTARIAAAAADRPVDTSRLDAAHDRIARIAAEQEADYAALAERLPND